MSNELNTLTQRLYAQGYTRENHPDTVCWGDWQNFSYKWETMLGFTWETPCGLLVQGESNAGRSVAISARRTTTPCFAVPIIEKTASISHRD